MFFGVYLQLKSVKFCEVGKNTCAPCMCCFNSAGHVFPPTRCSGNELLVVSKIVSFCKLETNSSHPQMTERFLSIFSREDKKRRVFGLCLHGRICVCSVYIHRAKNIVPSGCLHFSRDLKYQTLSTGMYFVCQETNLY